MFFFDTDEFTGTWINTEYRGGYGGQMQKYVFEQWGYYEAFTKVESNDFMYRGIFYIIDKWTDSNGNTLCKTIARPSIHSTPSYELDRFSKDGSTWEYIVGSLGFPSESELNPDNSRYSIYYRQE
jgi:hypothetical protein